jgi:hypothetical protein
MLAVYYHAYFTLERAAMAIGGNREIISSLILGGKLHAVRFENIDGVSSHELGMLALNDFLGLSLVPIPYPTFALLEFWFIDAGQGSRSNHKKYISPFSSSIRQFAL